MKTAVSIIGAIFGQMMEAAGTTERSANFYQTTWRNNPEDSHFQTSVSE
jgi:H+/gluconate symporter-like permease